MKYQVQHVQPKIGINFPEGLGVFFSTESAEVIPVCILTLHLVKK